MKTVPFLFAAIAASSLALAEPPAGRHFGGPRIERLAQDLGLDANQVIQVKAILDAQRATMEAERAQLEASGTRPSREEMQTRHEQMDADLRQQLSVVLTPEQLAKFEQLRKRRPMGPPPGATPGEGAGAQRR